VPSKKVNYGYIEPVKADEDFVFGASRLPTEPILPSADWRPSVPTYEPQTLPDGEETDGCAIWGTENGIEIYLKFLVGGEWNFSERFLYNLLRVRPPGTDPFKVGEAIRSKGLVNNDVLPITETFDEFIKPDPDTGRNTERGAEIPRSLRFQPRIRLSTVTSRPAEKSGSLSARPSCARPSASLCTHGRRTIRDTTTAPRADRDCHWCLSWSSSPTAT
jgi:hypothetical protein